MSEITLLAPAKLNLYLHITGIREDDYHLLDSLIAFTEFGDDITVKLADDLTIAADGPYATGMPIGEGNLMMRIARKLQGMATGNPGADIHVEKKIPVSAGVGGGSADAIAVMRALIQLWDLEIDDKEIYEIALELGTDLPVCYFGKTAFVDGIGENIREANPLPDCGVLLINPGVTLSTPVVFENRKGGFSPADAFLKETIRTPDALADLLEDRVNDLTDAAQQLAPVIREVLGALKRTPDCLAYKMSGSGATCWGIFETFEDAERTALALNQERPDWWVMPTRFL